MKINISVRKYRASIKIMWISFLVSLLIGVIVVVAMPSLRIEWVAYVATLGFAAMVSLIFLSAYHLKYYKNKI